MFYNFFHSSYNILKGSNFIDVFYSTISLHEHIIAVLGITVVSELNWDDANTNMGWSSSSHEFATNAELFSYRGMYGSWPASAIKNYDSLGYQRPAQFKII